MKFLHLADLHLDTSFASRSAPVRQRLRDATRRALQAAVEVAVREEVDAVLIAGDLFDGERLSFHTERYLAHTLGELTEQGIQVIYATGNHDPGGTSGPASRIDWPEGMTLMGDPEPRQVDIHRDGTLVGRVTGAGHATTRESDDLSARFPGPRGDVPEVALLHTQVVGARGEGDHHRYAPSERDRLRSAGYDYWALGHIHQRQAVSIDPAIYYAGSLQGRDPGEDGPRGGLLVQLSPVAPPRVEFVELAPIRWETLELDDLAAASTFDALAGRIRRAWSEVRASDPGLPGAQWLLRVVLQGPCPLHRELAASDDRAELARELEASLDLLDVEIRAEGVRPPLDPASHMDRSDLLGEALRLVAALQDPHGPSPSATLELEAGELAGFDGDDPDPYLRELLEGELPTLLGALLSDDAP